MASDPFAKHGIAHLSPSAINTFAAQPSYWALKYLLNHRDDEGNARMWRGSAVEAGLDHWAYKKTRTAAHAACLARFEEEAVGLADDLTDKERGDLPKFLDNAIGATEALEPYCSPPTSRQLKVEHWFDGIEVPVIGYTDYEWEDEGLDLKTTRRLPRTVPAGHARQVSLYTAARKKPYKLLYVTPTKCAILEPTANEFQASLKQLEWYAHIIRRALSISSDPEAIARLYPPDFSHFYWSDDGAKERAREVWE